MKIIRPGKQRTERVYETTCRQCDCVFEFQEKEARYHSDQRDGDFLAIPCPTCSASVTVGVKR